MPPKVLAAITALRRQGHTADPITMQGKDWVHIDGCLLATHQEMEEFADGVYNLAELEELYRKRRAEEQGKL